MESVVVFSNDKGVAKSWQKRSSTVLTTVWLSSQVPSHLLVLTTSREDS